MSKSLSNTIILALSTLGCIIALVLVYEHFRPSADIGCAAIGGNCAAAQNSDYGHLGPVPTSVFGLLMYATLVGICVKRRSLYRTIASERAVDTLAQYEGDAVEDPDAQPVLASTLREPALSSSARTVRMLDAVVWGISLSAVCISWWLQKVALFQLVSFCPWCMSSAFLVTLIFVAATRDQFFDGREVAGEQKLLAGTVTLIAAMGLFMVFPDIMHQVGLAREMTKMAVIGPRTITPTMPAIITPDMEATGPADAPFTIVEFADYQCPHCKKTSAMLNEEMKNSHGRYRLAFRNYPLPMHKWATPAAIAAEAAGEQGKFWEMHDYIFAHQDEMSKDSFSPDTFTKYAENLGLDTTKFEQDENSEKILSRVATDATSAPRLEIKMTPTFFVMNRKGGVFQLTGFEAIKAALDDQQNKAWQ